MFMAFGVARFAKCHVGGILHGYAAMHRCEWRCGTGAGMPNGALWRQKYAQGGSALRSVAGR